MTVIDPSRSRNLDAPQSRTASNRIGEVELLRAIAVIFVLLNHLPINLFFWGARINPWLAGFWVGVDLFFAISGFVIARSLLPRLLPERDVTAYLRISLDFWLRRAWRLLPSAWFWLIAPLLLCVVFNRSGVFFSLRVNWEMMIAGMLDLANFRTAMIYGSFPLGTAFVQWSLSLEEQFYLVLPLAAFLFRRFLPLPLLMIAALGFIVPNIPLTMMVRLWPIALGVLLAMWARHQSYRDFAPVALARRPAAKSLVLGVLLLLLLSVGTQTLHIVPFFQGPVTLLSGLLVWIASYDQGFLCRPCRFRRLMEAIAARSYSLYLVHIPCYFALHEAWFRWHGEGDPTRLQAIPYSLAAMLLTVAVAEANHRLLEQPLRDHGRRVADRFSQGLQGAKCVSLH